MTAETPRDRILAAADELFNAYGIHAVKLSDIIARARVSASRVYSEFVGKDAIVVAVLERRHVVWTSRLRAVVEAAATPREQLLAIFDFLAEWFAEEDFTGCCFLNSFGELGRTSADVARLTREHKGWFLDYVTGVANRGEHPPHVSAGIVLLAEGAQVTAAITRSPQPAFDARATAALLLPTA
ncbi:TetR/AcrR family transcriptional regulator [Microbacteriaceae bacterium VKM Ac-2854]|nr:TetR/AcrR family transcriptional regulator [Microbacteriaceae bacterium VKM Ac-2854]